MLEAAQEYTQTMMESFNSRYGSKKFKDADTFTKFITNEENMRETVAAGLAGAGGAVQFKALGTIPQVVSTAKGITDQVAGAMNKTPGSGASP